MKLKEIEELFRRVEALEKKDGCPPHNLIDYHFAINMKLKEIEELFRRVEALEKKDGCPPHNLIDYHFSGSRSASVPPPNKICTKCLLTLTV